MVPATSGVLRTKVQDMQIGDYIVCNYVAGTSGAVGVFSNLGGTVGTEIPVAGSATPNGSFYFVKTDKGLLIADRVCQFSISWDALNTGKLIQGMPWGNIIPTMTSNTAPSGVASASSNDSINTEPWKAFDGLDNSQGWATLNGTTTGWLQYEFPSSNQVTGYSIKPFNSTLDNSSPKSWTFEGWDGTKWDVLDTQTGISGWALTVAKKFTFPNIKSYTRYRINIIENNGYTRTAIGVLEMYEQPPAIIRSLTGGVAYADANGNSTNTSTLGFGGFPTNNEWDKYIVNFPTDKIQAGKTVDDVFHWNTAVASICQDTTMLAIGASTQRTFRGNTSVNRLITNVSTTNSVNYGFRPVLQYFE